MGNAEVDQRVHLLQDGREGPGPVLYWMSRDQRVEDNWALLIAEREARARKSPMVVVFTLVPTFGEAGLRAYRFMLGGLRQTAETLENKQIPFVLLAHDSPPTVLAKLSSRLRPAMIVTEFDPTRRKRRWQQSLVEEVSFPVWEVDCRNIVPCRLASDHREYAARTFRPKIHDRLPAFLVPLPKLKKHPHLLEEKERSALAVEESVDWDAAETTLQCGVLECSTQSSPPGSGAAKRCLRRFLRQRLARYHLASNDPNEAATSGLSPYLHFGQISSQRIALEVEKYVEDHRADDPELAEGAEAFLEQLIVRRELSDNFCHYCPEYDSVASFPDWARKSLEKHRRDPRPYEYDFETMEKGQTHESLWNAAQREMVLTGGMHNYLRMYWAKKILEWTPSAEVALRTAIALNDRYQLDGRETNGYTGIAWAIGGVHDQGWKERPVFGKIRYMNDRGAARKFDVPAYLARIEKLEENV
jgi:deoxyribodipyrimidine photo-lyase